ncbi:hypothetical protein L1276_004537 [Flavobacterium sp. HSC-32F16]|uniref:hypothetical protein n=1 Tax=Flavobacterium sp. HSC-32F16 TaxID=2910964 RepID=UPI0020A4BE69|nr:hypothetical protein [Flavobacterium sp. HSC-32F16]MCP2029353.1 hypothetical protein [Flavobacterium sp. HSC-32F16]
MEIDRDLVQEMINDFVGTDYVIHEFIDSSKYLFITYKHKEFYEDDERGRLIGPGPIVYNKETKEYKTSGSGDFVCGEYFGCLNEDQEQTVENLSVEEIKNNILRRKFVNDDDIWNLEHILKKVKGDFNSHLTKNRNYNLSLHSIYCSENTDSILYFENFWIELDLKYEVINPNEIVLWKKR